MKVTIPDTVSKTAASTFENTGFFVTQKPGIEIDECSELSKDADAVVVRSYKLHDLVFGESLKAIGRAGAGVNNIPVDKCTDQGVVVFNTPGANANGVKELIFCGMFLAARKIVSGINWTSTIKDTGSEVPKLIEKNKSLFKGTEIKGKNLGVIGLGAIGMLTANDANALGMNVSAYTRSFSNDKRKNLSPGIKTVETIEELLPDSDFLSINIAVNSQTEGLFNEDMFTKMKPGVKIINFARNELVNTDDLLAAIQSGIVSSYVTDFPSAALIDVENVIAIPHLGASTAEAEENCAVMVSDQIVDYLINGNIVNSVNFPDCSLERSGENRVAVFSNSDGAASGAIKALLNESSVTVNDTVSERPGNIMYMLIDTADSLSEDVMQKLSGLNGIVTVRRI